MATQPTIVWIRRDLRLFDNPALYSAVQEKKPVIPLFIWAPSEEGIWSMGEAQQWWLHHSLNTFDLALRKNGSKLIIRQGPSIATLSAVIKETGAKKVVWNKAYEPLEAERDQKVVDFLHSNGIETTQREAQLLHDPTQVRTGKGTPYKVYTPFWRTIQRTLEVPPPLGNPTFSEDVTHGLPIHSLQVDDLGLLPKINWTSEFKEYWTPGEQTALERLHSFLDQRILEYHPKRDIPSIEGTSRLSPHLHFGEISPRTIWHEITKAPSSVNLDEDKIPYLRQLIWREFAYHLMYHFPHTSERNLRVTFDKFPWSSNAENLLSWQKGQTGYPIVDAGMRQLWRTGWMHNRVRMIVASFLTKHLLVHWLEGAKWFWNTLLDANLPNNTMGWQWAAGSGADAQPFFRIFNPMNQGRKFDPSGQYVKKWVPELEHVPASHIHEPWLMDTHLQRKINVRIGTHYPAPVVDHKEARAHALHTYKNISN